MEDGFYRGWLLLRMAAIEYSCNLEELLWMMAAIDDGCYRGWLQRMAATGDGCYRGWLQ